MSLARGDDAGGDLVAALASGGAVPAHHLSAFEAVRRKWFIPDRCWVPDGRARAGGVPLDRTADPTGWCAAVHADVTIVTQFDDGETAWPQTGLRPTSSSTTPSVVAAMLSALDVQPGQSVLEIGTGTGYNTALLAHIVGPRGHVTTVEIDPVVAATARRNIAAAGFARNVRVVVADGTADLGHGPGWDRVVATAGVHIGRLPYAWVKHTRSGGVILAPMRADLAVGPLVRFVVGADGTARGHAVPDMKVSFMEMRAHRVAAGAFHDLRPDDGSADVSHTDLHPWELLRTYGCRWAVAVAVPSCRYDMRERTAERGHRVVMLHDPLSGSSASVVRSGNKFMVRQSGPRRLWDEVEAARRWWHRHGSPPVEAWEWTVTPDRQSVTLR